MLNTVHFDPWHILVPRAHDPFGLRQGSRPLAWQGPKQEVRESRTSGFCAQPQKFETITVTIGYKNGQLLRLRVTWTLPEVSILGADQKDRGLWGRECPWQRSLFVPPVSSANTKEKGPLLAGKFSCTFYTKKVKEND